MCVKGVCDVEVQGLCWESFSIVLYLTLFEAESHSKTQSSPIRLFFLVSSPGDLLSLLLRLGLLVDHHTHTAFTWVLGILTPAFAAGHPSSPINDGILSSL